jgi:hypothetical protein
VLVDELRVMEFEGVEGELVVQLKVGWHFGHTKSLPCGNGS